MDGKDGESQPILMAYSDLVQFALTVGSPSQRPRRVPNISLARTLRCCAFVLELHDVECAVRSPHEMSLGTAAHPADVLDCVQGSVHVIALPSGLGEPAGWKRSPTSGEAVRSREKQS